MASISDLLALQHVMFLDGGGHLGDADIMLEVWQRLWREFDVYVEIRDHLVCEPSRRRALPQTYQGKALIKFLVDVGLLVVSAEGYEASCEEASRCLRGSWLEEFGASVALAAGADEVRYGQKLLWRPPYDYRAHQNEVDVLARFGEQQLAFVSCKALRPLSSESYRGADRLKHAMHEVADWRRQFAAGMGSAILLTTADFVDEARHRLRNAALLERADALGVSLVSADAGDWNGLVEAFKSAVAPIAKGDPLVCSSNVSSENGAK